MGVFTAFDPPPHKVSLNLEDLVPIDDGWDVSRAWEAVDCLRNIAKSDGHGETWRARLCNRIADQIEAQAGDREQLALAIEVAEVEATR